ncbi:MAG: prepilin peptidase [bacterium]|nr:prepilin peptidase [bacterium]
MTETLLVVCFILGLIVGSFINVFIVRYKTGLGFGGRSFCFSCGHHLSWHELIPLFSFIFQKGRCRACNARISWRYPITELTSGLLFVAIFWKLGYIAPLGGGIFNFQFSIFSMPLLLYYVIVFSLLLAIVFYDIRHKIIPNTLVYFFVALSFLSIFLIHNSEFIILNLFSGPLLALPLAALWFFSHGKWIGLGDAKLMLGIGWLLGLSGGVAALILSFWIGAAVGLILVLLSHVSNYVRYLFRGSKRLTIKSEIPFAPFLVVGTLIAFLYDISFADIQSLFLF